MIFQYWIVVNRLLKIGIPYGDIAELSETDIAILLAIDAAVKEREQAAQARSMR